MEEPNPSPYRLVIFTDTPSESLNPDPNIWHLSDLLVLKFKPGLNPDPMNPKRYCLRYWRPMPPKQRELGL